MLEIIAHSNDINVDDRLELLATFLGYFLLVTLVNKIEFGGNLTLKVVNKSYFFNSSYKTYVNGLCFEASATS